MKGRFWQILLPRETRAHLRASAVRLQPGRSQPVKTGRARSSPLRKSVRDHFVYIGFGGGGVHTGMIRRNPPRVS